VANPLGGIGIEHGDSGRIRAEQAGAGGLLADTTSYGGEQIESRGDAAPERLRRDRCAGAREACALPLDGKVLEELVADGFDDERVGELAALDDLRRWGG
jgi:hypothetical protein